MAETTDMSVYLDPTFDPSTLTKPQLRSILAENGISDLPPSTAKKQVLLELFETRIRAKADSIRKARTKVRPSEKGITLLDEQSQPSPSRHLPTRGRSKSPSKAIPSAPGAAVRKRGRPREDGDLAQKSQRSPKSRSKSRQAAAVPSTPLNVPSVSNVPDVSNVSPLSLLHKALPGYADSPNSATMKLYNRFGAIVSANQITTTLPPRPVQSGPSFLRWLCVRMIKLLGPVVRGFFVLFLALVVGFYLRVKCIYPYPYCNTGVRPPATDFVKMLRTYCVPCPPHGICSNGRLSCADGFVSRPNWLFLGSSCQADVKKFINVENLAELMIKILSQQRGKVICQHGPSTEESLGEDELKDLVRKAKKTADWNGPEFESYFRLAISELAKKTDKVEMGKSQGGMRFKSKTPTLGLYCRLSALAASLIKRYRYYIWGKFFGWLVSL